LWEGLSRPDGGDSSRLESLSHKGEGGFEQADSKDRVAWSRCSKLP